jgi:putative transposase
MQADFVGGECQKLIVLTVLNDEGVLQKPRSPNAIESLNSVIRHTIKKRKGFPTNESVRKVIYLAIQAAAKKWTMPIQNWRLAMTRFMIAFEDRLKGHI